MYVLHWFLKYPHFSKMESCLCLWRIQSLKGTKWVQNPFQKPICYKQELTQVFSSVSVQFNHSVLSNSLLPHGLQHTRPPYPITNSRSLLKLMSIESVMPSNHLILCRPLLLLPSIFPSIRIFSNESVFRIMWPKYWSFSIIPSNEFSRLIL